jgi:L-fuculose-phosphate aldolase
MSEAAPSLPQDRGDEQTRLRKAICRISSLSYQRGFTSGSEGNVSARLTDGTLLVTPSALMKGFLEPHHIAHVDMQGQVIDGGPSPSSEVGIHFVAYEERPDVRAVCHAHPPHAVALTIAGIDMQMPIIPEAVVSIGGIPTAPFGIPGTPDLGESIREIVRCSDTMVMKNHGSVTLGSNLIDAYKKLDMLEHTAHILWLAHMARGGLEPLPPEDVKRLLDTRRDLGFTNLNTLENRCGM